jgi:acyl-CoA thioesterase-1
MKFLALAFLLSITLAHAGDAPFKIICFGDSITEGKTPTSLKNGERWIELVEKKSGGKFVCFNEGKGGRPASAVADLEPALKRHADANVLLIALGTNDSRDYSKDAVQELRKHIAILTCLVRDRYPKLKVVVCAPYNINIDGLKNNKDKGPQRRENLIAFGKAIQDLAAQDKLGFIDFYGVIPEASLTIDGVHPDAVGHAAIAEKAWAELQKILK